MRILLYGLFDSPMTSSNCAPMCSGGWPTNPPVEPLSCEKAGAPAFGLGISQLASRPTQKGLRLYSSMCCWGRSPCCARANVFASFRGHHDKRLPHTPCLMGGGACNRSPRSPLYLSLLEIVVCGIAHPSLAIVGELPSPPSPHSPVPAFEVLPPRPVHTTPGGLSMSMASHPVFLLTLHSSSMGMANFCLLCCALRVQSPTSCVGGIPLMHFGFPSSGPALVFASGLPCFPTPCNSCHLHTSVGARHVVSD